MKHYINIILIIVGSALILLFALGNIDLMPIAASLEAGPVDALFNLHISVIAVLYALVMGILIYSVVAFRRKPGDESEGAYFHGNTGLEVAWTIIPLGVVLFFAFLGVGVLQQNTAAATDEMEVRITAQQWAWTFEYPEQGLTSGELNLPVGRKVHLVMTATDVIHSFWVPEFRVKQDLVPGKITHLRVTPSLTGAYKLRCAELCGTGHAAMLANVNVMEPEDFDIWVQKRLGTYVEPEGGDQGEGEVDLVAQGANLAAANGCVACHSVDGSVLVGPSWKGVFGHTITLEDGSTITGDEAYIRNSIVNPGDQIVAGFANLMPANYGDLFIDSELDALVEYIKSLQ